MPAIEKGPTHSSRLTSGHAPFLSRQPPSQVSPCPLPSRAPLDRSSPMPTATGVGLDAGSGRSSTQQRTGDATNREIKRCSKPFADSVTHPFANQSSPSWCIAGRPVPLAPAGTVRKPTPPKRQAASSAQARHRLWHRLAQQWHGTNSSSSQLRCRCRGKTFDQRAC